MNRLKLGIFLVLVAASVAIPLARRQQSRGALRAKQQALQEQAELLGQLSAEHERLAKVAPQTNASRELSKEQHDELLRLRNEVGGLRQQTNALQKLSEENRRLRAVVAGGSATTLFPPATFPRESWTFAGYGTPEASLQSFFWGMSKGDRQIILGSFTGKAAAELKEQFARQPLSESEFSAGTKRFSGFQIISKEVVSNDEVLLEVMPSSSETNIKSEIMKLQRVATEWKLAPPVH
jgi:hypothetical protein